MCLPGRQPVVCQGPSGPGQPGRPCPLSSSSVTWGHSYDSPDRVPGWDQCLAVTPVLTGNCCEATLPLATEVIVLTTLTS